VTIENAVVFNSGAVAGYGTVAPSIASTFNFQGGSGVTGGQGTLGQGGGLAVPGKLTFGPNSSVIFGPGGVYEFAIENSGTGTQAGTDYSTLNLTGSFSITAVPTAPFTISLLSVNSSGVLGYATFDSTQSYQWTLLTTTTPITTFNSLDFSIDTSQFNLGSLSPGQFTVTEGLGDTSLQLNFTPVPEPSTWALMACGVGALGWMGFRRRRAAVSVR
jgi:hypothetical protein